MFETELKRKLRSLKKLEKKMRSRYLNTHGKATLIWNEYFSTTSGPHKQPAVKYPLKVLLRLDRITRKRVFEEYFYAVFVQHHKEEGFSMATFHDPEIPFFLDLSPNATFADIKKRFRELAHKYHPDKGGDPEKMIKLLEIYGKYFPKKK